MHRPEEAPAKRPWIAPTLLVAFLIVALSWPVLRWLWGEWQADPAYSHGPLIPLISLFLIWRQGRQGAFSAGAAPEIGSTLGLVLVLLSLGAIVWATAVNALYLAALILIPLLMGILCFLFGIEARMRMVFPVSYWAFAVPFPAIQVLSVPLQAFTAGVSTTLARWLGVQAAREGSRVLLDSCDLTIGAPCSGLHSLVALLALAAVMAHVLQGRWWARGLLSVLAVPVALVANVTRVVALLLVADRWGADAALGLWHDWSGIVFFGLAVVLLVAIGGWLGCTELRTDI